MACGCPVVTTDVGAVSEFASDGCNASIVQPRDVGAMADRLGTITWEALVAETLAFGSPDTVARHIEYMRSIGVGQVLCWMNFGGLPQDKIRRSMELFAREVIPRFL